MQSLRKPTVVAARAMSERCGSNRVADRFDRLTDLHFR